MQNNEKNKQPQNPAVEPTDQAENPDNTGQQDSVPTRARPREIGGREGLDPTRYGDWEKNGRCIDF